MNKRKPIFFSSDWHIYHSQVLQYSNRPFKDVDHMHKVLINNYNAIVPENGVCYFLGDMGLCSLDKMKPIIDQLNGTKVLILGNHDKKTNAMYSLGFDVVLYSATLYIAGQRVTMSHCPLLGVYREDTSGMKGSVEGENWHGESRENRLQYTVTNEGQFHLHGHTHATNGSKSKVKTLQQWDVGVDGNNYRPVAISKIESWISKALRGEL